MDKTYIISDLHGRYDLLEQILNFIDETDELICLGDSGDRGPQSYKTLVTCLTHPQITYLRGNHDQMLHDALVNNEPWLLIANGGKETFIDCIDSPDFKFIVNKLNKLPYLIIRENKENNKIYYLSHSGFRTHVLDDLDEMTIRDKENHFLWDRNHFSEPWPTDEKYKNIYIIHGHTPIPTYQEDKVNGEIDIYANGHKVNIDTGAVWTGYATIMNLYNFQETYTFCNKEN